ncbi:MAG: choice-of-anchor B family protein [Bacteroidota bacterium]
MGIPGENFRHARSCSRYDCGWWIIAAAPGIHLLATNAITQNIRNRHELEPCIQAGKYKSQQGRVQLQEDGDMKRTALGLLALVSLCANAFAQPQLDTLRNIHPRPGTALSSLWGYTAPNGREYALVGIAGSGSGSISGGTSIVDITDHTNPRVVTHIVGPNNTWREMKTYRHYAYVVTDAVSGTGVQIIDLSRLPDTASLVTTFSYANGARNINRSFTITISDGFMYLNGCANWSPGGILIFDLRNDPLNPQFVGEYQPMYIHDSFVLRDTIYASAIQAGGGLIIADARNKGSIQMIGRIAYPNSGTHNAAVTKDRQYVLTTDERSHPQLNVKVWDIGNLPSIPTATSATFTINPVSTVHNVHIRGDFAYCSWYQGYGLQIADISNPVSPVLAAGYRTSAADLAWESYPYFPSGKIIVGDMQTGLWIFRFSELSARVPVYLLEPLDADTVDSAPSIVFRWTRTADMNNDPHWYEVQLKGSGVDTSWKVTDSLSLYSNVAVLQGGQTYGWKVTARDEWNTTASVDSFTFVYMGSGSTAAGTTNNQPVAFSLEQNYPNPFNPLTTFKYELWTRSHLVLTVHNQLGQEIRRLVDAEVEPGVYSIAWDGLNRNGLAVASGTYYVRAKANGFIQTVKAVLAR